MLNESNGKPIKGGNKWAARPQGLTAEQLKAALLLTPGMVLPSRWEAVVAPNRLGWAADLWLEGVAQAVANLFSPFLRQP